MSGSRQHVALAIGLAVSSAVVGLRWQGLLEPLELGVYDRMLRARSGAPPEPAPVALIRIRESDLRRFGHPIPHARLADATAALLAAEPRAVGIDLYRDRLPAPDGRPGLEAPDYARLGETVTSDPRVVMVTKLAGPDGIGIPPPAFLSGPEGAEQVGFVDVPIDADGVTRRMLVSIPHPAGPPDPLSFAFQLATWHLAADGLPAVPDPQRPEQLKLGRTTLPRLAADDGPYARVDHRGYQLPLDFRDGAGAFPAWSLGQLLAGEVPGEALRERVVMLGTDSPSVKDPFETPLGTLTGLELHAHATSQLIRLAHGRSAPLASLPEWAEALWVLLFGLLGARLGLWNPSLPVTFGAAGAGLAALLALASGLLARDWFVPVVPPALAGVASAGLVTALVAVAERREHIEVRRLFSRFLRPSVADEIWREREQFLADGGRGRPPSRLITVTTLISDLKGYTAAVEAMDAEKSMKWINEYLDAMADGIERHGGVVDDYAGDGIKASFGFPVASETDAEIDRQARNAVDCALSMGQAIERLNRDWAARDLPLGVLRIGISTGPVVAGALGADRSLKLTTVGDAVNTAARLESFEKDGFGAEPGGPAWRVLVGEETLRRLGRGFEVRDLGKHRLPGKNHEIHVYRILRRAAALAAALWLGLAPAGPAARAAEPGGSPEPVAEPPQQPQQPSQRPPQRIITFRPRPDIGIPDAREGPATRAAPVPRAPMAKPRRAADPAPLSARAVAPGRAGLTLEAQPVLYWYLPESAAGATFVIHARDTPTQRHEIELPGPLAPGLQPVRLAEHGVELEPDVDYAWVVSIGAGSRSVEGAVRRIAPPAELHRKLDALEGPARAAALAAEGIWYDAFAALSSAADRRALLRGAGLHPRLAE